jgi:hypothetical protein
VVQFAAASEWAQELLLADQPVVVVIEDRDRDWEVDELVSVAALGDQVEGALCPGAFRLSAMVFIDDDPDGWGEADLDGGALVEFSVVPGEAPFALEVSIEAAGLRQVLLQEEDYLNAGDAAEYRVDLRGVSSPEKSSMWRVGEPIGRRGRPVYAISSTSPARQVLSKNDCFGK